MNSLQDYWNEQDLHTMIRPTYESRLQLTESIFIDPHKPNNYFIPLDELPEYKRELRNCSIILNKRKKKRQKFTNEKIKQALKKGKRDFKAKGYDHRVVQPEHLTNTDSSEDDRDHKRIHINNRKLRKSPQHTMDTNLILQKERRNILSKRKGIDHDSELSKGQTNNPNNTHFNGKRRKILE